MLNDFSNRDIFVSNGLEISKRIKEVKETIKWCILKSAQSSKINTKLLKIDIILDGIIKSDDNKFESRENIFVNDDVLSNILKQSTDKTKSKLRLINSLTTELIDRINVGYRTRYLLEEILMSGIDINKFLSIEIKFDLENDKDKINGLSKVLSLRDKCKFKSIKICANVKKGMDDLSDIKNVKELNDIKEFFDKFSIDSKKLELQTLDNKNLYSLLGNITELKITDRWYQDIQLGNYSKIETLSILRWSRANVIFPNNIKKLKIPLSFDLDGVGNIILVHRKYPININFLTLIFSCYDIFRFFTHCGLIKLKMKGQNLYLVQNNLSFNCCKITENQKRLVISVKCHCYEINKKHNVKQIIMNPSTNTEKNSIFIDLEPFSTIS